MVPFIALFGQAASGGGAPMLLMIAGTFAIMYFLVIRPQSKQAKEQQAMRSALKKGDDVVTTGGLIGKVWMVADKTLTLEIASGVKIRVLKESIATRTAVIDDPAKSEIFADKADKKEGA